MSLSPLLSPKKPPLGPQLLKGAILTYPADKPTRQRIIVFQYNPELMSRSLAPQYLGSDRASANRTQRFKTAPVETISVQIEIDATDALGDGDSLALKVGIHPLLSALALLVYPSTDVVNAAKKSLTSGSVLTIVPAPAPVTLFVWGDRRIVPVRVDGIEITEQAYDPLLNPIRATANLKMTVLTYSDFDVASDGFSTFLAYQTSLEAMAAKAVIEQKLSTQVSEYS